MEAAGNGGGQNGGQDQAQLLISGVGGDQPLVMSAEDAAQFLAQAGLQLADVADSGEQVIINSAGLENAAELVKVSVKKVEKLCVSSEFCYLTEIFRVNFCEIEGGKSKFLCFRNLCVNFIFQRFNLFFRKNSRFNGKFQLLENKVFLVKIVWLFS